MTALDAVQAVWSALQIGDCRSVAVTCPSVSCPSYQIMILLRSERELREVADRAGWPTLAVDYQGSTLHQAQGAVDDVLVLLSYQVESSTLDDSGVVL